MNGTNSVYLEEMYRLWKEDPSAVHKSWDTYFRNVEAGYGPGQAFIAPPQLQPSVTPTERTQPTTDSGSIDKIRIMHLVRAFQVRGHEVANLDPLGLANHEERYVYWNPLE